MGEAHSLLQPLLGAAIAPTLFGIALLCCGLNSTVTATMAGQIVMEGFIDFRMPPWMRRLVTRGMAIVPAAAVTIAYGESGTAKLLILSQVILSLQLPFAVIPLVTMTASRAKMGPMVAPLWLQVVAGIIAATIVALNVKLLLDLFTASALAEKWPPVFRATDAPATAVESIGIIRCSNRDAPGGRRASPLRMAQAPLYVKCFKLPAAERAHPDFALRSCASSCRSRCSSTTSSGARATKSALPSLASILAISASSFGDLLGRAGRARRRDR